MNLDSKYSKLLLVKEVALKRSESQPSRYKTYQGASQKVHIFEIEFQFQEKCHHHDFLDSSPPSLLFPDDVDDFYHDLVVVTYIGFLVTPVKPNRFDTWYQICFDTR